MLQVFQKQSFFSLAFVKDLVIDSLNIAWVSAIFQSTVQRESFSLIENEVESRFWLFQQSAKISWQVVSKGVPWRWWTWVVLLLQTVNNLFLSLKCICVDLWLLLLIKVQNAVFEWSQQGNEILTELEVTLNSSFILIFALQNILHQFSDETNLVYCWLVTLYFLETCIRENCAIRW